MEQKLNIEDFINQKRKEGQSDDLIMSELIALGWDKNIVLQKLAGVLAPTPDNGSIQTSQTGSIGAPIQVENVQYNVKVKGVSSKIGLTAFLSAIMLWIIAFVVAFLLLTIRTQFIPDAIPDTTISFAEALVFCISLLAPVAPLFVFLFIRMKKLLAENPANRDDLFFKRSIRFNLIISLLIALAWSYVAVYNILGMLILKNQDITGGMIADGIIFAVVFITTTLFFWHYQRLTKR